MGNIVLLDDLTINKIAAGEVIERPANVVKELVENSIDAGAKNVTIEIKNGGKSLIKITDNGKGMKLDDMQLSIERHATSKIRKVEDLENTYSMGFRGEALASITAISKLTMVSKTDDEDLAIKLTAEAGDILNAEEVAAPTGTTITVEELFFNTPVRYKFLKNDATEFRYIREWLEKVALANPQISFKLINDGKNVLQTNGSSNLRDVIYLIYGKEIDSVFLSQYTRYGRNSLLNLCEDYALHIYEKFYSINKKNTLDYIRKETKEEENNGKKQKKYKLLIPIKYKKAIFKKSYKELKEFIENKFYPLIEQFIKRGCNINCHTEEKKFKNKSKEFEDYKYFNNYGKIYPIMYLISYPESEGLINLIKKYKIDINSTDLKNQTLLMYLLEMQKQIKNINKKNYQKIFDYLIKNCKNLSAKNSENKNLFIVEFENGNQEESLKIYEKLGDKVIDINDPCYNNYLTIIGNAIVNSNEKQIEFLLNNFKNINLNKIDIKFNRNALHYICMKDSAKQEIDFKKY